MRPGKYRHFKKKTEYEVLGVAKHSETLEDLVVYRTLYNNDLSELWVRPRGMFEEVVEYEDKNVPRFEYIEE